MNEEYENEMRMLLRAAAVTATLIVALILIAIIIK